MLLSFKKKINDGLNYQHKTEEMGAGGNLIKQILILNIHRIETHE